MYVIFNKKTTKTGASLLPPTVGNHFTMEEGVLVIMGCFNRKLKIETEKWMVLIDWVFNATKQLRLQEML